MIRRLEERRSDMVFVAVLLWYKSEVGGVGGVVSEEWNG